MTATAHETVRWRKHLQSEVDAAFLYRELAQLETDAHRRGIFERLALVEDRHVALWRKTLEEHGADASCGPPSRRARLMARLGRWFGPASLVGILLREEGAETKIYLGLHRDSQPGAAKDAALTLARDSAHHARTLQELGGGAGEAWHNIASGGFLRNVVYGFNDGLTANFGLVAGVLGADFALAHVVLSGIAGTVADALSMGSSGYLAAKSEREVYEHEIAMEREEIRLMPELEQEELALMYEAKGMRAGEAQALAAQVMQKPEQALDEMVREELQIGPSHTSPMREAVITGSATAVGALIPVL
ncbi:MAG: VIT1/CCC1 transporter family protein, partial [Candidatus Hydrogenedentes bacterium]|nr:VIT1/CCC1 transporter family protein [Candidatus Hydrogenedentota bacterium]